MSSPAPIETVPPTPSQTEEPSPLDGWRAAPTGGLAALRAELDTIDDAMHDLLIRRARVVEAVARSGKRSALRPGREASIIRRLVGRHQGNLPAQALYRIWRELLAATTGMQGGFGVAVCDPDPGAVYTQLAREQFGALTPLRVHHSPSQAIGEVSGGTASVAVLPLPSEADGWWTALLHSGVHVVAKLPFWSARPEGSPSVQALVVAPAAPDASEHDRSLLALEFEEDISRTRLTAELNAAGFAPGMVLLRRDSRSPAVRALVEVEGYVTSDDPRLGSLPGAGRPLVVGGYAVPIGAAA